MRFIMLAFLCAPFVRAADIEGDPWPRHVIDNTAQGADGARLADVNADGLPDISTPWEEGGLIRVYLHPGVRAVAQPWPPITVGQVGSPEDAVFADLDADGAVDVVSCTEGNTKTVWVHWAPSSAGSYTDSAAWRTEAIPATAGNARWMFCAPMQIDGKHGIDLLVGSKNPGGQISWLEAPANPRDLSAWRLHPIAPAEWIMSIIPGTGESQPFFHLSDRRGPRRGLWRFDYDRAAGAWAETFFGGRDQEVMFACAEAPWTSALAATCGGPLLRFSGLPGAPEAAEIPLPPGTGTGKSVAQADLTGDGLPDIVFSCENAGGMHGVVLLESQPGGGWSARTLSGIEGTKFDLLQLVDLDFDGDLDVLTCEERENLGVIWYENPLLRPDISSP